MKQNNKYNPKFLVINNLFFILGYIIGIIAILFRNHLVRYAINHIRLGYWRIFIGKIGEGVKFESNVNIRGNTSLVEIGDFSFLDLNVNLEVYKPIKIGKYVHITPNVYIQSGEEVIIGNYA